MAPGTINPRGTERATGRLGTDPIEQRMTTAPAEQPDPSPRAAGSGTPADSPPIAERIPLELAFRAASRIVSVPAEEREDAGRRLIEQGGTVGLRSDLMWGVLGADRACPVRQVALVVPSSGRTAVTFLSDPTTPIRATPDALGDEATQLAERIACLRTARTVTLFRPIVEYRECWPFKNLITVIWFRSLRSSTTSFRSTKTATSTANDFSGHDGNNWTQFRIRLSHPIKNKI